MKPRDVGGGVARGAALEDNRSAGNFDDERGSGARREAGRRECVWKKYKTTNKMVRYMKKGEREKIGCRGAWRFIGLIIELN